MSESDTTFSYKFIYLHNLSYKIASNDVQNHSKSMIKIDVPFSYKFIITLSETVINNFSLFCLLLIFQ